MPYWGSAQTSYKHIVRALLLQGGLHGNGGGVPLMDGVFVRGLPALHGLRLRTCRGLAPRYNSVAGGSGGGSACGRVCAAPAATYGQGRHQRCALQEPLNTCPNAPPPLGPPATLL